jgi:hypothetical protein
MWLKPKIFIKLLSETLQKKTYKTIIVSPLHGYNTQAYLYEKKISFCVGYFMMLSVARLEKVI